MASRTVKYSIDLDGPLFRKDVRKTVGENIQRAMEGFAEAGEEIVRQQLTHGHGYLTGRLHDSVIGRTKSIHGHQWRTNAVVSPQVNLTMPRFRGYATFIETGKWGGVRRGAFRGYKMFAAVKRSTRAAVKVLRNDYTKGLS